MRIRTRGQRWAAGAGLVAAGVVAGGIMAGTVGASAEEPAGAGTSTGTSAGQPADDPSHPQRPDEQLLTGDTRTQVEAAVLAANPGATIERTETDSGGVYESHIVTSDGQHVVVQVGADFAVTGTDTAGGPGGGAHRGGPGPAGDSSTGA